MKLLKKTITKEDGRALTYYHFPDSASVSQTLAFENVSGEPVVIECQKESGKATAGIETENAGV